ncbi:Uncharacterised protein [Candidatus Burarchaeum australiense]|nr:Uncharacterised protein [Candidatus Burarchaeum australiense]
MVYEDEGEDGHRIARMRITLLKLHVSNYSILLR